MRDRLGVRLAPVLAALTVLAVPAQAAPKRALSLDQCADQFVMALSPREAIVGVSHRADDPDSHLRRQARGLPKRRASFEAVWTARPEVVVRYWGGEPRLVAALERRGVTVVALEDATDFAGVRRNVQAVAAALDRPEQGRALLERMDADLRASAGAWRGADALYVTPGAYTTGPGTLVDAMLRAAGIRNAARALGFHPAPLEQLVLHPPAAMVRGFFDIARFSRWQLGRHAALRRLARGRASVSLPGAVLGCPAWFAAAGARTLAEAAPRRP